MAGKLTSDEIKAAGRLIDKIYREQGLDESREALRELKARMIMCGNTDSNSKSDFHEYTGYTWDSI